MQVGARLREIRLKLNMTQEQVSNIANISSHFLSNIENGKEKPSLDSIGKLAQALKVPVTDLFKTKSISTPQNNDIKKIEIAYDHLQPEQKQLALNIILNVLKSFRK